MRYGREMASDWTAANVSAFKRAVRERVRGYVQNGIRGHSISDCARIAIQRRERSQADRRAGNPYRRGAGAISFAGVYAVSAVGIALVGQWWDPVSWWDWFTGAVATGWNDLKQFIHDVVKAAVDLLDDGINLFYYVFTVVTNALQAALTLLTPLVNVAWSWVSNAAVTVGDWIEHAAVDAWNNYIWPAIQLVHGALDFAVGLLQYAISEAAAGLSWLVDNIISPAWSWIQHAAETVGGWIWQAIDGFYRDFILPIIQDVQRIGHDLYSALDWLFNTVAAVVNVVMAAWDWLVWFGVHTFSELHALFADVDHALNRDWLLGAAHNGSGIADEVARWLEELTA